jgi:hypothetical protein
MLEDMTFKFIRRTAQRLSLMRMNLNVHGSNVMAEENAFQMQNGMYKHHAYSRQRLGMP